MAKVKAFGAPPQTLQDKVAVIAARQAAFRDEAQRAQTSEGLTRKRLGVALASVLAEKAQADLRAHDAQFARYLDTLRGRLRPDRRNRLRRRIEQVLARLGPIGHWCLLQWSGLLGPQSHGLLFDAQWYRRQYPDVSRSGLEPLVHYLVFGGDEGRSPHPLFDDAYYRSVATDLGATGLTPLAHYQRIGFARGLSPHPLIDVKFYLAQAPDLAATGETPLNHYIRVGAARDLSPSRLFQPLFYRQQLAADETIANPLLHYVEQGFARGLRPHPLFDPTWFKATYPEVGAREPVSYFIRQNTQGPVDPSPWFDTAAYLRARGDRRLTRLDPLSDYLAGGAWIYPPPQHEAAASAFAAAFPEVAAMGLTPLEHWAAGGS